MDERGVTMRSLSLRAGLKHNAVANIMSRNLTKVNHHHLESILRVMGTSMLQFWESDEEPPELIPPPGTSFSVPSSGMIMVPDCGLVEAGSFRLPDIQASDRFIRGTSEDRDAFALTVHGDSMAPEYLAGETIFLKRERIHMVPLPRGVRVGVPYDRVKHLHEKDCIVLMADEGCTFKRLNIEKAEGQEYRVTLLPVNPTHNKTVIRPDHDIWIQGVCYKSIRRR